MAEGKKYYWLKLKDNFFNLKEIKKLRKIAGGDTYTIIYLKLQLLSLQDEGKLFFENIEDAFSDEMALMINEEPENVKITIMFLQKYGLIEEIHEAEFLLPKVLESIGSETRCAERVRKHREAKKLLQCNTPVTIGNTEIEIEKEIELEIDIINVIPEDATENERTILNYLKGVTGYTIDYKKDLSFIRELAIDFPKANILEKIKEWNTWLSNNPLTKRSNPRLQIRNWIKPKDWGKRGSKVGENRKFAGQAKANVIAKSSTPTRSRKASEWED